MKDIEEVSEVTQELLNRVLETGTPVKCKIPIRLNEVLDGMNQIIIQRMDEETALIRRIK